MKVICDFTFALIKVFLGFKNLATLSLNILVALKMTRKALLMVIEQMLLNEANDSSTLTFSPPPVSNNHTKISS